MRPVAAVLACERALRAGRSRQRERPAGDALAGNAVDRLGRERERQLRERDQVAVDPQRMQIDVVERVARLVVALVELVARDATPDRLLLGGLLFLGAREQAARGDVVVDERLVVCLLYTSPSPRDS